MNERTWMKGHGHERMNEWIESFSKFERLFLECIDRRRRFLKIMFVGIRIYLESSWRDVHELHPSAPARPQNFSKNSSTFFAMFSDESNTIHTKFASCMLNFDGVLSEFRETFQRSEKYWDLQQLCQSCEECFLKFQKRNQIFIIQSINAFAFLDPSGPWVS
jgi:DNA replicative helicase MCM subunit Mcm2 (Cdc46/Mcm family)